MQGQEEDHPIHRLLWAKSNPRHPLWCHLLDVGAVSLSLLPTFGPIENLPDAWVAYLVALHDVGKADPLFQNRVPKFLGELKDAGLEMPLQAERFRHESRSSEWIRQHLKKVGWGEGASWVVAQVVRGHHGNFRAQGNQEPSDYPERYQSWEKLRARLATEVRQAIELPEFVIDQFQNASTAGVGLVGLTVLSDWIASNPELYRYSEIGKTTDADVYWSEAKRQATDVIDRLGFAGRSTVATVRFNDVWPKLHDLRPVQRAVEDACTEGIGPGLAIVEAPTGEGKTEAAVYLAQRWSHMTGAEGAYIALPTQATSNQMHSRYSEFIRDRYPESDRPRLLHGMAWLIDDITPLGTPEIHGDEGQEREDRQLASEWFANSKRALLAPHGVGTVDQVMMSALNVRHGFLRLFGLSKKVLIIDEVHAYDEYMGTIIERLLRWCGEMDVGVIMLSATLSRRQKNRLIAAYAGTEEESDFDEEEYPLLTFVPHDGQAVVRNVMGQTERGRRVHVIRHEGFLGSPRATADLAVRQAKNGSCVCVLVNTIASAQKIYNEIRQASDITLYLFHSRFRAEQRAEIERSVVGRFGKNGDRPKRSIVVATQVIEQSLDVDFDVMITEVAPADLLLQRIGRLWRHDRERAIDRPELHLILPDKDLDFGGTGRVYQKEPLLRTMCLFAERDEIVIPDDCRSLVEGCYSDAPLQEGIVPDHMLEDAVRARSNYFKKAASSAREHLIAEPTHRDFSLAWYPRSPVAEDEEGTQRNFFHAQTRMGQDSVSVVVLHDLDLVEAARQKHSPRRRELRKLFLQKATVPIWWLDEVEAAEGWEAFFKGAGWLRDHTVIPFKDGEWVGRHVKGHLVTIQDDPILGLIRKEGG